MTPTPNIVKTIKTRAERLSGGAQARSQRGKKPSWHASSHGYLDVIEGGAKIAAAILTAPVLRGAHNRWGATPAEVSAAMPGDELVPKPKITSTRAITINARPHEVWPWLAQIGQGRGGFYSYDALENLARCDIHSADRIIPQLQQPHPGDLILLAPAGAPCFRVSKTQPPSVLTLVGADPKTRVAAPIPGTPEEMASTWQWVLHAVDNGRGTRLVVRQRLSYPRRQSALWHLVEPVGFVMERRTLHGIKARAEGQHTARQER
jgi:hypothetical protein